MLRSVLLMATVCSALLASETPRPVRRAVEEALQAREYGRALALVDGELKRTPNEAELWTLRGIALSALRRGPESLASYRRALGLRPDFIPALERAAEIEYRTADPNAAKTLDRIIALRPNDATAHAMLAVLAYEKGRCEAAAVHFAKAGPQLGNNRAALDQFGDCLVRLKRPGEAAEIFRRMADVDPNDRAARYNLGLSLLAAGQPRDARAALLPLADAETPESDELALLAEACRQTDDIAGAVTILRRATRLYPRESRHYLELASLAMDHDAYELGLEIINVGIANLPQTASLYVMRGVLYGSTSQFDRAEADFDEAARLSPDDGAAGLALGVVLQSSQRLDEAIQVLRHHVERYPGEALAHFYLTQSLFKQSDEPRSAQFKEASRELDRALQLDPGLARAHYLKAKLLLKLGDEARAAGELEKTIELEPDDRSATYMLLRLYTQQGRTEAAARLKAKMRERIDADRDADTARKGVRLVRVPDAQSR